MTQCLCYQLLNVVLYSLQDNPEEAAMFDLSLSHIGRYFLCLLWSV